MAKVNIKIEGFPYQVEDGITIMEAAKQCGYEIPSLCSFNHGECSSGSCRVCLVEASGTKGLVASCVYPVNEGMEISISSEKATKARRASVELLLSNHNPNCQQCRKNGQCELLHVANITGARANKFLGERTPATVDQLTPAIIRDTSKCILCGRCVSVCPTGALMTKPEIRKVDEAFAQGKFVVVQTAPAVRAALGEEFGMPIGTPVTGKMVAALHRLGFHKVYDPNCAADLTIMEEGTELLGRIQNGGVLPMITSCSPGWINYAEFNYPDLLPHLSTCKSPQQMQGAIIKSYYAEKNGLDPKNIFMVSIMPCTAKKFEKERPELEVDGIRDVDAVLTTRELGSIIRRAGILFEQLPDEDFDDAIIGEYSGAGDLFGVTGGVMEAALRTVYHTLTGKEREAITFESVRGFEGVREASVNMGGMTVNVAIAHGMKNAKVLLDEIRAGTSKYHFIEIMGCPGGCIGGGGQPIVRPCFLPHEDRDILDTYRQKRARALYREDERQVLRQSHNNPQVKQLYAEYLGEPNSHKAHHLLHTSYAPRERYSDPVI